MPRSATEIALLHVSPCKQIEDCLTNSLQFPLSIKHSLNAKLEVVNSAIENTAVSCSRIVSS